MAIDLTNLRNKVENNGENDQGVLRATDFNNLVNAVIENQNELKGVVKGIRFGSTQVNLPNSNGIVTLRTDATDTIKFSMISPDGQYSNYTDYMNSFPSYILAGDSFTVRVRVSFTELIDNADTPIKTPLKVNFKVGSNIVYSGSIYDFNVNDSLIKENEKTLTFNYSPYLAKNSINEMSFEIIDPSDRIDPQIRVFNKVFVVNTTVSLKLEGTVNNLNVFDNNTLTTGSIVVNTTSNKGKLELFESSLPNTPIFSLGTINDTTTTIKLNNEQLNNIVRTHGNHVVYAVLDYNIPGTDEIIQVRSNEVAFIFYNNEVEQTEPLASINKVSSGVVFKEYGQLILNYIVYLPSNYNGDKELVIKTYPYGKAFDENNEIINKSFTIIDDNMLTNIVNGNISYLLTHKNKELQIETGKYNIVITFGNFQQILEVEIQQADVNLEDYNIGGQIVYFKSSDKSPGDKTWQYVYNDTVNNTTETFNVIFNNFDFSEYGSGFKSDESIDGGQTVLQIKRGSSIEIPYPIFKNKLQLESTEGGVTGKTISIEFKTYNCISQVKPIITCIDTTVPESDQVGFIVYPNKMVVKTRANQTFEAKFKEDEHIKLDFVVEGNYTEYHNPTVSGTKGEFVDDKPSSEALMIIYVNGVYQRLHLIGSTNDTFSEYLKDGLFVQNLSNLKIGSEGCDIDLYNVKLYEKPLSPKEIVFNYAFDTPKFEDRIKLISRNDIWTDDVNDISKLYDISRQKLTEKLPDLPIFSFEMHESNGDNLPLNKKDWKFLTKSTYYNKNITDGTKDTGNISFSVNAAGLRNQGTSSMNYPMPWRNWDWKPDVDVATESGSVKKGDPILDTYSSEFYNYSRTTLLGEFWKQYDNMPANSSGKDGGIKKLTFKKDYASSEMCNNAICSSLYTDMAIVAGAKSEFANVLAPTGNLEKYGYRLSLIATPCFMYQELTGDNAGTTKTLGMMNLIPNKNETGYLGLGDINERSWNILDILSISELSYYSGENETPRTQAWEVSENHVIWDTKYESYSIADVDAYPEKYTNIKPISDSVKINFKVLTNKEKPEDAAIEFANAIENIKNATGLTEAELVNKFDYYIVLNQDNTRVFLKISDKNADKINEPDYVLELKIESYGTYINSVLNNYEARYPKDSSGKKITKEKINIWGDGNEADFGFAPDTDWIFNDAKTNIEGVDVTQSSVVNAETRDILRLHNWLVDCHPANVVNGGFIKINGTDVEDKVDNRLKKFREEAKDYLIIEQWILYYIWRELFWMFDSGSKNLQVYTIDGMHWGCMVRDADTALGINNLGVETFPAHIEDIDYYAVSDGKINFYYNDAKGKYSMSEITELHNQNNRRGAVSGVLNGQFGSIWLNLRDSYKSEIAKMAKYLFSESQNKFTADKLIKAFDEHQEKWSESLYNFGMRQYFGGPLFTKWMTSGNGNKKLSRKDWITKAFDYRLGKYQCYPDDQTCHINWRATSINYYGFEGGQKPADIEIENLKFKFYQPCYLWSGGSSSGIQNSTINYRITTYGDDVVNIPMFDFAYPRNGSSESNMYIYGMHNVTDLGPLYKSLMFSDFNPFNALTKVTKLELGHKEWSKINNVKYSSPDLKTLALNGMPKLQYLDITNYEVVNTLSINECTQLEELYIEGTDSISEVVLPKTVTLKTIKFGKNITTLDVSDLTNLSYVSFEDVSKLNTLKCNNCSEYMKVKSYEIVKDATALAEFSGDVLWGQDSPIEIDELIKLINKKVTLRGTIYVKSMNFEQKLMLISKFGEIDFNNPATGLRVISSNFIQVNSISVAPKVVYAGTNDALYTISFAPDSENANNMLNVKWTVKSGSFSRYFDVIGSNNNVVSLTSAQGKLTIKRKGELFTEQNQGETIVLVANMYTTRKLNNEIVKNETPLTAEVTIKLYNRYARPGDIVYHDGTYSSYVELDTTKIPVGVCFYTENNDVENPLRLMLSLENTVDYNFGLASTGNNCIPGIDSSLFSVQSVYDISAIENTTEIDSRDESNTWEIVGLKKLNGDFDFGDNVESAGIRQIGRKLTNENNNPVAFGEFNTKEIINHRNTILRVFGNNTNDLIPVKTDATTELASLKQLMANAVSSTRSKFIKTNNDSHGVHDSYLACCNLFYYPAASYAYAYEPRHKQAEIANLSDKFKSNNWFLPTVGEMIRILYYYVNYLNNGKDNIFKDVIENNILRNFSEGSNFSTSSEYNADDYITIFGWNKLHYDTLASDKGVNTTKHVLPICKF